MQNKKLTKISTDPVYTIGIAAEKCGLSVHTLRLYESEGLIISHKTKTGRRLYSDLEINKIQCIHKLIKDEGLNFEGIRRMLSLVPCWKIRGCKKNRESCNALKLRISPCWATKQKCLEPFKTCRECPVYCNLISCEDIAKYINNE